MIKRKDNPELFEKYLNTLARQGRKLNIATLKLKREIDKIFRPIFEPIVIYLENKLSK